MQDDRCLTEVYTYIHAHPGQRASLMTIRLCWPEQEIQRAIGALVSDGKLRWDPELDGYKTFAPSGAAGLQE